MARKRKRTRRPRPQLDPTVRVLLRRIRLGDVPEAAILADYLADRGHPRADRVCAIVAQTEHGARCHRERRRPPRGSLSSWEEIALWYKWQQRQIGLLFGFKWRPLALAVYRTRNLQLFNISPLTTED